jgi:pimeloyl-ACP methyl ester carboxylesterase
MKKPSPRAVSTILKSAGAAVGRETLRLYRSIDPDVTRHVLQMPLLSYTLVSSRTAPILPQKPDGHRPLIFVHGLGGTRGDFLPMSGFFWLAGRRRSYRIHFPRGQGVEEMARRLAAFVRKVMKVTGERKVDLVAHSLGGLVSRLAVLEHGLSRNVGTLITLGSPLQGTHCARFANTDTLRELRPSSPLLKRLEKKPWPRSVRGISFWSRSDLLILPAQAATTRGMEAVEMTPFTHYSYLLDPKGWVAVREALS